MNALSRLALVGTFTCFITHTPCLAATDQLEIAPPPLKRGLPVKPTTKTKGIVPKSPIAVKPVPLNRAVPGTMGAIKQPRVSPAMQKPGLIANPNLIKPDLTITQVTVYPANPTTADTIGVSAVIHNAGIVSAPASRFEIRFAGSTKTDIRNLDILPSQSSKGIFSNQGKIAKPGRYRVTFIADINNNVQESNENNNAAHLDFEVINPLKASNPLEALVKSTNPHMDRKPPQLAFGLYDMSVGYYHISDTSMIRVTFRTSKPIDQTTLASNPVRVNVKYFVNGSLSQQVDLIQKSLSGNNPTTWEADTIYGGACTSAPNNYCELNIYVNDTLKSMDGENLDGDGDGQPGGQYHKTFYRGMNTP